MNTYTFCFHPIIPQQKIVSELYLYKNLDIQDRQKLLFGPSPKTGVAQN